MKQIAFRIPEEMRELLRAEALRSGKTQNAIITEALAARFEKNRAALEQIQRAVVAARAKGPCSKTELLELARQAAARDDREGLGPIKVNRRRNKRAS